MKFIRDNMRLMPSYLTPLSCHPSLWIQTDFLITNADGKTTLGDETEDQILLGDDIKGNILEDAW